jgi:hypothetical protein
MLTRPRLEIRARRFALSLALLTVWAVGCGSGGGGDAGSDGGVLPPDLSASFSASGTAGAPDLVRIGGSPSADLVEVDVVIGGPTTSDDLYSFAFDLVLGDPTVAELVEGSATLGSALTASDGQAIQLLVSQQDARVIIGATKLGGGLGNGVEEPGESAVVHLVFRLLRAGSTSLALTGSAGREPAAIDSDGAAIDSVRFDGSPAVLTAF